MNQEHFITETGASAFLEHFNPNWRGAAANYFYQVIRAGAVTPAAVALGVETEVLRLLDSPYLWEKSRQNLLALESALLGDRDGALRFAEQCLQREQMPAGERQALKAAGAEEGRRVYMAAQPATEKQLAYLRSLGCADVPDNRLQASEWINQFRAQREEVR